MRKIYTSFLTLALLGASLVTQASTISFTTSKAVGETFAIAMNPGVVSTVTWADGSTEELVSDGTPQELTLKSTTVSLTTDDAITTLYVANDGITRMDLDDLRGSLTKLYCGGNAMTSLNLNSLTALAELDCSGNMLTSLRVYSPRVVNCSDNRLTSFSTTLPARLEQLYIANNQLKGLGTSTMSNLQHLYVQGNDIRNLRLNNCTKLLVADASQNGLTSLNLSGLSDLQQLWISGNSLETLDLTSCPALQGLIAPANELTTILWNDDCKSTLSFIDVKDNTLFFNSFPTVTSNKVISDEVTLGPQRPYPLMPDGYAYTHQEYNWSAKKLDLMATNGWGQASLPRLTITDSEGNTLVAGNDSTTADYRNRTRRLTFWDKAVGKTVTVTATSTYYPDVTLTTTPFVITTPTGISSVTTDEENVKDKTVYNLNGQRVDKPSRGVYIVNGKKVIIR